MNIGYHIFQTIFRIILRFYFQWEVYGLENIPLKRGGIIACNHTSYLDPGIAGTAIPRPIYYLARKSLYKNAFAKWFINTCHGIPIKRGGIDREAINTVSDMIKKGELVVAFPEGKRSIDGNLQKAKPGIGMIAYKARSNIIPCYIDGAIKAMPPNGGKWPRRAKIRVYYGKVLNLTDLYNQKSSKETFQNISDEIITHIAKLRPTS